MQSITEKTTTHNDLEDQIKGKAEKKTGNRIGYNYIILKSLKESTKNDVVKCLYIKSLTNFGFCVIKEGTYGDSKDKQGRDIKDRLLWQKELHEQLQDKVRLPRLLGSFEENGNYYLVLERIKGKSLHKACSERKRELREALIKGNKLGMTFLDYLIQIISLLETLHTHHVVHRDVTATNFMIMPNGKVAVIDMELSYSLNQQAPSPPFRLGTFGYMSPEQEATKTPTIKEDIFSIGAIILQVWTGISPSKLTNTPIEELHNKVQFLIPDKNLADIVVQCLHTEPEKRPPLKEVRKSILDYKNDLEKKIIRPRSKWDPILKEEIIEIIQRATGTLASPLLSDEQKGWFSDDLEKEDAEKKKLNKVWYASFSKGAAGILYTLSKVNSVGITMPASIELPIQKALLLIKEKYIDRLDKVSPSLHFGSSGIAACLATSIRDGLIKPNTEHLNWISSLLETKNEALSYLYGVAGQGIALLQCRSFLDESKVKIRLAEYTARLLETQLNNGSWVREAKEGKNRSTRGFAQGVAGIIYYLLKFADIYGDKQALSGAQHGLQWLITKAVRQKESIQWNSSSGKPIASWWNEGAAGIGLTFLEAYSITRDVKYKEYAIGSLNNHSREVIDNNLSQSNGISGLGQIYMEAFRVLQDQEWLKRAEWITQIIVQLKKEHSTFGPYWLIEHERQPVADFMSGNSGVIHYLLSYCHTNQVKYPLFPE